MAQDWNIKSRATACSACQVSFIDGQPYHTRLIFQEHDYSRGDYCEKCWGVEAAAQPRYSSWKGYFKMPPTEPDHRIKKETAESLLRELIEGGDAGQTSVIYILAVMLERQRVLVEREIQNLENGIRVVIYEHKKSGETFAITDPQLKLTALDAVQKDIMALLTGSKCSTSP
ncbi:MAG: hypothetical protein WCI03_02135 [bacterium]|jgi:hypothetical protein